MSSRFVYPPWDEVIRQGDASVTEDVLLLTLLNTEGNPRPSSVGRALNPVPVDLRHSPDRSVNFETTFTFRISSSLAHDNIVGPGHGLAFFITDTDPPADSFGVYLGIFRPRRIVAVEFVTHPHPKFGQPDYPYVGININSVTPSAFTAWKWQDGDIATAKVTYNSGTGILRVEASYPHRPPVILEWSVQLNSTFPERVRAGFSASTEEHYAQKNEVLSWTFETTDEGQL